MDENNYKMKNWGQEGMMSAEVKTAVAGLQVLNDRSEKGEISMTYAKKVGADMIRNAKLCAKDSEGTIVVECVDLNKRSYVMEFAPFGWVISSK